LLNAPREVEIDRKIEQSIAFMKEHLDCPLQAATLAALAHISLSHFFALFKRRTGATPIDYFIHLRMERACQMLEATSLAVKEVAAALGYEDPFYFSRVFKSVNAVAPSEYRLTRLQAAGLANLGVPSRSFGGRQRADPEELPGAGRCGCVPEEAGQLGSSPAGSNGPMT
jgi:AraC-like DNA-binding protein